MVEVDLEGKFSSIVRSGQLNTMLVEALALLQCSIPPTPAGSSCHVLAPEAVSEALKSTTVVTTGGSLSQLRLDIPAYPVWQAKRIELVIQKWDKRPSSITELVGTIKINADMWDQTAPDQLCRASNDSEIAAVALICLFVRADEHVFHWLTTRLSDVVFQFIKLGTGTGFLANKFRCLAALSLLSATTSTAAAS